MPYRNVEDLSSSLSSELNIEKTARLYALRCLYKDAIRVSFRPPAEVSSWIALTEHGKDLPNFIRGVNPNLSEGSLSFVAFLLFFHENFFVDVEGTDDVALAATLQDAIVAGTIKYPWMFDHILYDHAYTFLPKKPDSLSVTETLELLANTPPGVFQISEYVTGPIGVLRSKESRYFPPTDRFRCGTARIRCVADCTGHLHNPMGTFALYKLARSKWNTSYGLVSEWTMFLETP